MTITVTEFGDYLADEPHGTGCLRTERGNLPLHKLDVRATVTGLVARTELIQGFGNPYDTPLEATYVFPLPDRAALIAMTLTADGRTIVADLQERAKARQTYDAAIAEGRRASVAEEERPDVFTMRVGNIAPGERVEVALTLVGPLPFEDGEATFRFPLVVAPRYIPGHPLGAEPAGDGYAPDTDATPDASRITPPVLLPGFPNPVELSIEVVIDPAGLPLGTVRSSRPRFHPAPALRRRGAAHDGAHGRCGRRGGRGNVPAHRPATTGGRRHAGQGRRAAARPLGQHAGLEDGRRAPVGSPHHRHARLG